MARLVFGLFGATLGAQPSYKSSRSFFVLTLGIIAVYYVIGFSFSSLGVAGTLPLILAHAAGGVVSRGGWSLAEAGQSLICRGRITVFSGSGVEHAF